MKNKKKFKGVVYSTNPNYNFEYESNYEQEIEPSKQTLEIWIDKHRAGKIAVIIKKFIGNKTKLKSLAKMLKKKCSVGGTVKNNEIIIQGDIREKIISILEEEGYKTKRIGG